MSCRGWCVSRHIGMAMESIDVSKLVPTVVTMPVLPGSRYRETHQASVIGILGANSIPIISCGTEFKNIGRWTFRLMLAEACSWAEANPGTMPTPHHVREWVSKANTETVLWPHIQIAETPNDLPHKMAMALVGGAYHESWHSLYSCQRPLTTEEVANLVLPRWAKVKDWSKYATVLLDISNDIEDIRIERLGVKAFPGTYPKMVDLQDFILHREALSNKKPPSDATILVRAFRDLGLGYQSELQRLTLGRYKDWSPTTVEMVESGAILPLLEEAISLSADDDLGCIRIAMDLISMLENMGGLEDKTSQPTSVSTCPACGASQDKLRLRSAPQFSQIGIITCTVCGWQTQVDIQEERSEVNDETHLGIPETPLPDGDWAKGVLVGMSNGVETLNSEGAFNGAIKDLNTNCPMEKVPADKTEAPYCPLTTTFDTMALVEPSTFGKGHDNQRASELMEMVQVPASYLRARFRNRFKALELTSVAHGVRHGRMLSERMLVESAICLRGGVVPDRAYCVASERVDTSGAIAVVLDESSSMKEACGLVATAKKLITDSKKSRQRKKTEAPMVLSKQEFAAQAMTTIIEPFDAVGCATLCIGFRSGEKRVPPDVLMGADPSGCHRSESVHYDIFKTWDEPFQSIRWRFVNTKAVGTTPMADGIQMALNELSRRPEKHKLLYVVTDGKPDSKHVPVINRQVRIARAIGVYTVGVGLGEGTEYVQDLFEDSVYSDDLAKIAQLLFQKTNDLLDRRILHGNRNPKLMGGLYESTCGNDRESQGNDG